MTTLAAHRVYHTINAEQRCVLANTKSMLRQHTHPATIVAALTAWVTDRDNRLVEAGLLYACAHCDQPIVGAAIYDETQTDYLRHTPESWTRWCSQRCQGDWLSNQEG